MKPHCLSCRWPQGPGSLVIAFTPRQAAQVRALTILNRQQQSSTPEAGSLKLTDHILTGSLIDSYFRPHTHFPSMLSCQEVRLEEQSRWDGDRGHPRLGIQKGLGESAKRKGGTKAGGAFAQQHPILTSEYTGYLV
jgi:hypothetical protein